MATKRSNLKRLTSLAFKEQAGCCIYCDKPMWLNDPESFAQQYKLTQKQALQLQCTGEHLFRHSAGGKASRENIVAAHRFGNHKRHQGGKDTLRLILSVMKCSDELAKESGSLVALNGRFSIR